MSENTLALKIRLGNVQEWLSLVENPLHCAQLACVDALREVYSTNDKGGMGDVTDLTQTVNRCVAWCVHAQWLVKILLDESKAPSEVATPHTPESSSMYDCDVCGSKFVIGGEVQPGAVCPVCDEGIIDLPATPHTPEPSSTYFCDVCGTEFEIGREVQPSEACPACDEGTLGLPIPF